MHEVIRMTRQDVKTHSRLRHAALALLLVGSLATPASAQYFGGNKVRYKDLDFQVMKTEHFDIYFYPSEREGIDIAARLSERWLVRLQHLFGHELRGRQPLVLYASHPDFEQTNAIEGELGEGTGGVTEPLKRRIILPLGGPLADTDHVIGHELVHAFQFDITTRPGSAPGETGANRLPLWFIEGMAEYLSIGPADPNTAMWLRDAAREETLPSVDDLNDPKYFPYRWGQALWAYIGGKWGDEVVGEMLRTAGQTGDPAIAIQRTLGVTTKELSEEWHAAIRSAYGPVLAATTPPSEVGTLTIKGADLGGDLNVGPAISPDGRWIAFLSERSLFSIDLYLADATTGKVVRKLTSTTTDPHFSSLQFIHSAGAWDSESRRLAIATVTSGKPAIAIFEASSGNKEREFVIDGVDEIFNPTWAPDGQAVCFTGMSRGLTDLFLFDLSSSTLRRLTSDPYADLQPAWSPDGKRIAFATDRFSSQLDQLNIGPYRLAILDLASSQIEQVTTFPTGKNINPQWAPDGRSLFFISDRDGIPNLYRVTPGAGVSQITRVSTGLSGITGTSPAVSVASKTGMAAFAVYDKGNYHIYTLDVAKPDTLNARAAVESPVLLPPLDRRSSDVAATLADASTGLPPADTTYEVSDYKSTLGLVAVGQPTIAVGADRFGAAIGGGLAFYFGDMLGDQTLVTAVQLDSGGYNGGFSFKNTSAQVGYFNQKNRLNWGFIAGQTPYLSGGIAQDVGTVNGEPSLIEQTVIFRQTDRNASAVVAYPFNRAQRVEFQGGVSQLSFDQITTTEAFSLRTGQRFARDTQTESLGAPLTLATSSAALVYDTSVFGATSPVQGQRYRFEAAPTFGTINYTSMLADYRRYFMPASFYTFAARVLHYGRYGSGGEDERLFPLFLGYPSLVRGYDVNSFDASDCVASALSDCPAFDRLVGSRVLVGNIEFRFPLLRPFGASKGMYGPLPVEVALFADGGVAWSQGDKPEILGGSRKGVSSVGAALRVNLLGFAIGEFALAKPLQRSGQGWVFQFNLSPGF
jgi:hypothetical protein